MRAATVLLDFRHAFDIALPLGAETDEDLIDTVGLGAQLAHGCTGGWGAGFGHGDIPRLRVRCGVFGLGPARQIPATILRVRA
jgi:hypothetical protein